MRKVFLMLAMVLPVILSAQDFEFEKIINVNKSRSEIYSASKMFVADFWNSAKAVTQNQDDASYTIQIKALKNMEVKVGMAMCCVYDYTYTVKIQAKENKCRIQIYDVVCRNAYQGGFGGEQSIPEIQPFLGNETEQKTKKMGKGLSKKKAVEMMKDLKSYFENIISEYEKALNDNDEW